LGRPKIILIKTEDLNEQLVKEERIKTKPVDISFEVFNADDIKNREVTRFVLLKIKINGHKK